jgi:lipopolysaccharide heptosyltransferase II
MSERGIVIKPTEADRIPRVLSMPPAEATPPERTTSRREGYNRARVSSLQFGNRHERMVVQLADVLLRPLRWWPTRTPHVERILLLRLERIGDLLMTLEAIADVRATWPDATIDLAVGSWNEPLARLVPGISRVHVVDVPWLSRGERPTSWPAILQAARRWKKHRYDLMINFEPDIRSNLLGWLSGAPIRAGYASGGGGPLVTRVGHYDTTRHVADNARALVGAAAGGAASPPDNPIARQLQVGSRERTRVDAQLASLSRPLIGLHVSGGRESKQWHLDRFAAAAARVADATSGTIVLTGAPSDQPLVDAVISQLTAHRVVSMAGTLSLPETAALMQRLDVLITGDTGPMHLAAAMGAPVVALFGPSDPARYGPRAVRERIVRVQLPCSPCGLVRLPPERCRGHVPECMDGITVDAVVAAAFELLASTSAAVPQPHR